jgi:hypothetical protein
MNLQQFFTETLNNNGASYSILTGELNPTNGYFVSIANKGITVDLSDFNQKVVADYISQNAIQLNQGKYIVGSWIDNGVIYLDVS